MHIEPYMALNILIQGSWIKDRDLPKEKENVEEYFFSLARHLINSKHKVLLATPRYYDLLLANEIERLCKETDKNPKDYITFLLSDRFSENPTVGRVFKFPKFHWWSEERTFLVQKADVIVSIGGGKGTADCVYKAFLIGKPVFVGRLTERSRYSWLKRPSGYYYLKPNDSEFIEDNNISADEFFDEVFKIIDAIDGNGTKYSRRIFVIHGRDYYKRDKLVKILKKMDFEPIVLEQEPSRGLTIVEKLEQNLNNVGFSFVIYTPDDVGKIIGGIEEPRARQNVIFEHGLLIGVLGRDRVCALICGDVKMPSDLQGLIYEKINEIDREAVVVAHILTNAGYIVDMGKLIEIEEH